MDLVIECNVELCKTNCEICPENQNLEPGRRRRDVIYNSTSSGLEKMISGKLKVIAKDDLTLLELREHQMSSGKFK